MGFFGDKKICSVAPHTRITIIVSQFNETIGEKLLNKCLHTLKKGNIPFENIEVIWVPGAFEIPLIAQKIALKKESDLIITLGAVIRGDTPHFDYVCEGYIQGIMKVQLKVDLPIIFGVLTCDNAEQALARSQNNQENKGYQCALAALEMLNLINQL